MGEEVLHALWTKISLRNDKQRLTLNFTVQKKKKTVDLKRNTVWFWEIDFRAF